MGKDSRKMEVAKRIDTLLKELERIDALPEDHFDPDDVLLFRRVFPGNNDTPYTYVAVKLADGRWWLSGKHEGLTDWDRLTTVFASGQVTELWQATEWEEIELP